SGTLAVGWLAAALAGLGVMAALRRAHGWDLPADVAPGVGVWVATPGAGGRASPARGGPGLLAPARPPTGEGDAGRRADELSGDRDVRAAEVRDISFRIRESVPVAERLADVLHPWTSYVIVPLFALANAGVRVTGGKLADAATSRITLGVVAGLVVGKLV